MRMQLETKDSVNPRMTFQITDVKKPLASVRRDADATTFLFDDDGSYVENKATGERINIATETLMAHLSIHIRMGHALQKKERLAVGKHSSLRDDIAGS